MWFPVLVWPVLPHPPFNSNLIVAAVLVSLAFLVLGVKFLRAFGLRSSVECVCVYVDFHVWFRPWFQPPLNRAALQLLL